MSPIMVIIASITDDKSDRNNNIEKNLHGDDVRNDSISGIIIIS